MDMKDIKEGGHTTPTIRYSHAKQPYDTAMRPVIRHTDDDGERGQHALSTRTYHPPQPGAAVRIHRVCRWLGAP